MEARGVGDVEALLVVQQRRCVVATVVSMDAMSVMPDVMSVMTKCSDVKE
jgi:hypothetical protein